jgi:hypothetical protein
MFDRRLVSYFDWGFAITILGMGCLGVLTIYSANALTPSAFRQTLHLRQLTWLTGGLVVLSLACTVSYRNLGRFAYIIFGVNVFLLLVVLCYGKTGMGAAGSDQGNHLPNGAHKSAWYIPGGTSTTGGRSCTNQDHATGRSHLGLRPAGAEAA